MPKEATVPARKAPHGTTADLSERREIRIMHGHAVPYPRIGDRRALIAPGTRGGKVRRPEDCLPFAVVEFSGRTCVKVHAAMTDYAQAKAVAQTAARSVSRWLNKEIVRVASRNGNVIGKALPPVKVVDRTRLYPGEKRARKVKIMDDRPAPTITRKELSEDELTQKHHSIDRRGNRACRHCGESTGANMTCGVLRTDVPKLGTVATLADAVAALADAE